MSAHLSDAARAEGASIMASLSKFDLITQNRIIAWVIENRYQPWWFADEKGGRHLIDPPEADRSRYVARR